MPVVVRRRVVGVAARCPSTTRSASSCARLSGVHRRRRRRPCCGRRRRRWWSRRPGPRRCLRLCGGLGLRGRCGLLGFGDVEQGAALGDLGAGCGGRAACCGSFLRLRPRLGLRGLGLALGGDVGVGVVLAAVDVGVRGGVTGRVLAGAFAPAAGSDLAAGADSSGSAMSNSEPPSGISVPGVEVAPPAAGASSDFARLRLRLGLGDGLGLALGGDVRVGVVLAAVHLAAGLLDLRLGRGLLARGGVVTAQVEQGTATEALVARLVR